jgi:hypothetical protein
MGRPFRPCPPDFAARYPEFGEEQSCEFYRAAVRSVRRWVKESDEAEIKAARRAYVQRQRLQRFQCGQRRRLLGDC